MTGIFNPKDPNASVSRPEHVAANPDDDRWYAPCTSPEANDGTLLSAQDFNMFVAQLRRAIRGMEVVEDPTDDDMLLKAIQAAMVDVQALAENVPLFPEIKTADNKMTVSAGTGEVIVSADEEVVFRGLVKVSTFDWSLAQRTLAHAADKTYHLRLSLAGGFALKDLEDAGYNPSALAETDPAFDSTFDDMLIAKVVTNGSNVATITRLRNAHALSQEGEEQITEATYEPNPGGVANITQGTDVTLDWARRPRARLISIIDGTSSHSDDEGDPQYGVNGIEINAGVYARSRYKVRVFWQRTAAAHTTRVQYGADM